MSIRQSILFGQSQFLGAGSLATSTVVMDANTEEASIRYIPTSSSPMLRIALNVEVTGDLTGVKFRIRVEGDDGAASPSPNATVLGATANAITPEFEITADGLTSLQELAETCGVINVPCHIILYRSSGVSLDSTHTIGLRGCDSDQASVVYHQRAKLYTGTWGTATGRRVGYVVQRSDATYDGLPIIAGIQSPTSATDIHSNYRHGLRFKTGSQIRCPGVLWYPTKTGSPNRLIIAVFEGATLKYSQAIPAASIVSSIWTPFAFSSPVLLAADTNLYIVLGQEADAGGGVLGTDGGDDSNDYDSRVHTFSATYRNVIMPPDWAFVYGTGNDPTSYTVSNTEYPMLIPMIVDPATDLDQAAGGGLLVHPGMSGGLRG